MSRCAHCGGKVTGERGGLAHFRGRPYHRSCLREKLNSIQRRRITRWRW